MVEVIMVINNNIITTIMAVILTDNRVMVITITSIVPMTGIGLRLP
jgi:hypothetical protein